MEKLEELKGARNHAPSSGQNKSGTKVNRTSSRSEVEKVNLREDTNPVLAYGAQELEKIKQEKVVKEQLGKEVMVKTASGGRMYSYETDSWIDDRYSPVPLTRWIEYQAKMGKLVIKE